MEASEIFPTEKSTSNKLCTVLPTVVFTISISFCHYSCLFKINQSILYFAIFKIRPSIFGTQFFHIFSIRKQAKKSAIIFSYQSQISIRFILDLTYLKIHISVPKSIPSEWFPLLWATVLYKVSVWGSQWLNCQPSHKLILILCFFFVGLKILK